MVSDLPVPDDRYLLRVSDADREQVAERLREAAGQGRITLEELDTRLDASYAAKTYADLAEITRDLPVPDSAPLARSGQSTFPAERIGGTPRHRLCIAIMSGVRRKGPWVVPPVCTAVAFMGGVDLDLREARFSQPEVKIRAFAMMGGVNVIVPEDIEVDVTGIGFMGGFDHEASGSGVPGAPVVRVTGLAFMGGVDVKRKLMKKPKRQRPEVAGGGDTPELEA